MGSGPCWDLLTTLHPKHWYSAHMHCRFDANVQHNETERTKFVALDKCLPNRKFLDFLDIGDDNQNPPEIKYDLQWLTVLHLTNNLLNVGRNQTKLPLKLGPDDPQDKVQRYEFTPTEEEMNAVLKKFNNDLTIPTNFTQTAIAYDPQRDGKNFRNFNPFVKVELNPQTTDFCVKLSLDDPLFLTAKFNGIDLTTSTTNLGEIISNEAAKLPAVIRAPLASFLPQPKFGNDEEIDLDELEGDEEPEEKEKLDDIKIEEVQKQSSEPDVPDTQQTPDAEEVSLSLIETQLEPLKVSEDSEVGPTPAKKFKRRNLEIYAANEDE